MTLVVAILGIFAAMAATRFGHDSLANAGAKGYARKVALDFLQAQRCAISTGDNHYVQFSSSGGTITGHALYRRAAGGDTAVDSFRSVPTNVTVTLSHTVCEYAFEGSALAGYTCTFVGPDRTWVATVTPATGSVRVTESP